MPSNHFAPVAAAYAQFRPRYPAPLYEWLAGIAPGTGRAWDCACGSGQASVDLATRFARVDATDASAEQLAQAPADPRVHYGVASAESSGFDGATFDLVTVAQALHWFDCPRFYAEAKRVLKPDGVLAAWSYGICSIEPCDGNDALQDFYTNVVGPYWPAERHHVDEAYRGLVFPEPRLPAPPFALQAAWTLGELAGYVRSWSATARYTAVNGEDPVPGLESTLLRVWGDPAVRHTVRWPLTVLATILNPTRQPRIVADRAGG